MSDPRLNDPRFEGRNDPVLNGSAGSSSTWAWVGGIAAVVLIAILALGNWHSGSDTGTPMTANNPSLTAPGGTPGSAPMTSPSTTGSGATSPMTAPAPSTPPAAAPAPAAPPANPQ